MSAPASRTIAAIDIGSNSFQITVARIQGGNLEIIERVKETVRLSGIIDRTHIIPDEVIDRTAVLLSSFRDLAMQHGAELRVSGTAALRDARNASVFVERAREIAQLDVRIISPMDEARLVRQGVLFGMPGAFDTSALCVDVGGGSTELSVGGQDQVQLITSVPRGALNVQSRLLGSDPVVSTRAQRARVATRKRFAECARSIKCIPYAKVIATGGTIQRIARIVAAIRGMPVDNVDGFVISRSELNSVERRLIEAQTQSRRLKIPGMDPDRADVLLGGTIIFETIGHLLNIEEWTVSMSALRTGLLTVSRWPV